MKIVRTVSELRTELAPERRAGKRIALVPTMGAFHSGHLALMAEARRSSEIVVVSLFVNPTQFSDGSDLCSYPRDEARDAALATEAGVDILFAPPAEQVYPPGFDTTVTVGGVTEMLEGDPSHRGPEHFAAVATVVLKLFNSVGPNVAYFGQKDAQQVLVVQKLTRDLDLDVEIVVVPTVRDHDGLALSSRNIRLSGEERMRALSLSKALAAADDAVAGGRRAAGEVLGAARAQLDAAGVTPEYLELRSANDLTPAEHVNGRTLLAVAARIGPTRLIDNTILGGS